MLCHNLIDKLNYLYKIQEQNPESDLDPDKLIESYCETQCSLKYCEIYQTRKIISKQSYFEKRNRT